MAEITVSLTEIAALLRENDAFVILCHRRPDGDTLGSGLALYRIVTYLGKRACLLCADAPPPNLWFLFGIAPGNGTGFSFGDAALSNDPAAFRVAVDVASREQLGALSDLGRVDLRIDHHEIGDAFAERSCVDAKAAACGEILFELAHEVGIPTHVVAEPLYAALSSDTGGFRFANTTSRTLRMAAALLEAGADGAAVSHNLYESRTPSELRALSIAYGSLRFFLHGKVAMIVVTTALRRENDLSENDLSLFSSVAREPAGVILGINLRQDPEEPTKFRISARSAPGFPANVLCAAFGGGGHAGAAGGEVTAASPEEAVEKILLRIEEDGEGLKVAE